MDEKSVIEQLSENPDLIAEMSREDLETAKAELKEAGRNYLANLDESDDKKADLAAAQEAKERLEAVTARLAEFEAEDAEVVETAAGLEESFVDDTPEATEEIEEVEETPEVPEVEDETPEVDVVLEPEKELVEAVAAVKPSLGKIAERAPKTPVPEVKSAAKASMQLSGDYPNGFAEPADLGAATKKVMKANRSQSKFKMPVASFDTSAQHKYEVLGEEIHDSRIIDAMLKDLRADSVEALTAAAGFCAPAEPLYDYFGIAERAGLIQLPTLNASRGQITYRTSPSYASVLANASWSAAAGQTYTEANVISGASKTSFDAACPSTTTCSVDAFPVDIRFTNFTDRFDPETVANVMENTMIFHDHYVNSQHIAGMVTASTARGGGDTRGGGLVNVANLVGFEAMAYRDTFRMSPTSTLELVIPAWVIDALVADLVARNATTSFENARARVLATFASLNVRVQAVQDWQSPGDAGDAGWRTAADFMLYAPGTFVRLDGGTLDLGVVRDSTLNSTNEFSVFVESFESVCEIGHDSWLLDDITICPRGSAGADVTLDCNPGFGS